MKLKILALCFLLTIVLLAIGFAYMNLYAKHNGNIISVDTLDLPVYKSDIVSKITAEATTSTKVAITNTTTVEDKSVKLAFDDVYRRGLWGGAEQGKSYLFCMKKINQPSSLIIFIHLGGGSGPGSTVTYTINCRKILYKLIKQYNVSSMLDAPCGAMAWMPILLANLSNETNKTFRYHGVDVVESVVNSSRSRFSNRSDEWQFSTVDFTQHSLPANYELIFSRDALQHLPMEKVVNALRMFSLVPGARFLLVGSYVKDSMNRNIGAGDYFSIDLTRPPFNLNNYISVISEDRLDPPFKHLVLYDIPNYLSQIDFEKMLNDVRAHV
jgi:hypothetical protein